MAALDTATVVGVVGAGAMGSGIAQVAAAAGHPVLLFDTRADAAGQAVAALKGVFGKLADKGKMSPEAAKAAGDRLTAASALADLAPAGLVIEAVVEDLAVKHALCRDLEALVGDSCILATNTSSKIGRAHV